mmetsp:Transcript_24111/g.25873  ORF Transcript_24111/g.25873 Transcript_24111/m.25873 type:complete len:425 (-) Transcript_24111:273-1547(-)
MPPRRLLSRRLIDDSRSSCSSLNNEGNATNKCNGNDTKENVHMQKYDAPSSSSSSSSSPSSSSGQQRRRSSRGHSCLTELAKEIVTNRKRVVFITGAGMSVASGVRPFRGKSNALWTQKIWTTATREIFRKDPLDWYNDFWLPFMTLPPFVQPNEAHRAMDWLLEQTTTLDDSSSLRIRMITQNVDGLIPPNSLHSIEAHGRIGLFKCMPDEDSDTDSESDDDDDRLVHLGHRRKWRRRRELQFKGGSEERNCKQRRSTRSYSQLCPYQHEKSLSVNQIEPSSIQKYLREGLIIPETPKCPHCTNTLAPQALLFDEGYHSHDFYEFQKMEEWLSEAEIIVYVGTSFAVRLPEVSLEHARAEGIPVYNLNTYDMLSPTNILDAYNIRGPAEETLPLLVEEVEELQRKSKTHRKTSTRLHNRDKNY